jgi:membrane protease subunit (stomatin/prohibitin family)
MGFADRMNEGLRGARISMGAAEVRQRLLEAQIAQEQAFTGLGVVVHTALAKDDPATVDSRFATAFQIADAAAREVVALQAEFDSALTAQAAPATKFCVHCGTQMPGDAAFCPSCGTPAS